MRLSCILAFVFLGISLAPAQDPGPVAVASDDRELLIRTRYEEVLARDPLQEAAFDRVYDAYLLSEGVDAWLEKLAPAGGEAASAADLILRGRILARQFRAPEAIEALVQARELGESGPAFNLLLGRLYYETGRDDEAIAMLGPALDATENPEQRSAISRMLGSVYLRSGKRAEAAAAWERIAEANPGDLFALQEMAEIYEENSLWDEAIAARRRIIEAAANDPYRQCHAWRAIGQALAAKEDFAGAIAAYEAGLALAAPGNWLFEDLKGRLVGVYESMGDLEGLAAYLEARIVQDPGDLSFRELLADVRMRRGETDLAEAALKDILARAPGRLSASEMLIALYRQAGRMDDLAAQFEALISQYPADPDYLRRLGDAWLENKAPEKAKATWSRVLGDGGDAEAHALLASWLERSEFYAEAASAYEAALALRPEREWQLRLAGLKYDMGDEAAALSAWQAAAAPEDTPAEEIAEIAGILLSRDFKDEAQALYARAMQAAPENLDFVLAYARLLAEKADHSGAAEHFGRLAEQDENEYFKGLGERGLLDAYAALGTLEQQRAAWEGEILEKPQDIAARLKLARLQARAGNRPAVVGLYEACVAIEPERLDLQRLLAEAYKENRQAEKAIAAFQSLMEKDAGRAPVYVRELLALHGAMGMKEESIRAAEKLVEISPSSPEARTTLAGVYLRYGEQDKALQQYRDAIQIKRDEPAYYREFGDALTQANRPGEAQEIYRKMLEYAGDDATRLDAVTRLATAHVRSGQINSVLEEFQRKVAATPKSLLAYQELAAIHRAAGDLRAALETLERARGEVEDTDAVLRLVMAEAYGAGDHAKYLATYEELMARSAQPTAYELERLAGTYALAGRMEEAVALWERIGRENPDDAAIQSMLARALEANGLFEEARAYVERALALDPYNYGERFEFAQRLLALNDVDMALEQLNLILEIGEKPTDPQAATATPAPPAAPSPPLAQGGFGRPNPRAQTFEGFRRQVVQSIVQTSRQIEGVAPVLEAYRKRIEDNPANIDARRDYLLVCEAAGEQELALAAARELSQLQPDDIGLRWQILGYLRELGETDEAIQIAREIAGGAAEGPALQAKLTLASLYTENEQPAEAEAIVAELTAAHPDQPGIYLQIAGTIQASASVELLERLYKKAAELDPANLLQVLRSRARLHQDRGDFDTARALLMEAVFSPPLAASAPQAPVPGAARRPTALHVPQSGRRARQNVGNMAQLPGFAYPIADHQRTQALNDLWQLTLEPAALAPIIARLWEEAGRYAEAGTEAERRHAGYFAIFHTACLRNSGQTEEALAAIEALAARKPGDPFLLNLQLYLLDDLGRYDAMEALYARLEGEAPALAPDIARARLQLALVRDDVAALPALYRALPPAAPATGASQPYVGGGRANQLSPVVHALQNAGQNAEAIRLLEEELAQSRDARTLMMASRAYGLEKNHDKAIELARELWQGQSGGGAGRVRGRNVRYSQHGVSLQSMGIQGLDFLWNAYREAGREGELIDEFKDRLEGQPASIALRQSLAGLYIENRQYDLAREQMEKLLELRPNDIQLKLRHAGLLESNNDPEGALALLESIAASRPSTARGITREIQRLYRELGKSEALAELQERMLREARTAGELQELAQELGRAKEFEKAAEVLERAYRLEPDNSWLQNQRGDLLWQAERHDAAIDAYLSYFQPATPGAGLHIDTGRMPELIKRFESAGRLDELNAIANSSHPDDYTQRSLRLAGALIARHEKRLEDAENILKEIAAQGNDHQVIGLLADLAEERGDLPAAITYLEGAVQSQGNADYRRLAGLNLKLGAPDKAILYWKKFADQHGGYLGHDEAVRTMAEAGATETVKAYFTDVYNTIPAADPARRQLAEALIRAGRETGFYDELIDAEVFKEPTRYTAELALSYAQDFLEQPGVARRRIEPLAARFPEELDLQRLLGLILSQLGDLDGAIAIFERLMADETQRESLLDNYTGMLLRSGQPEKCAETILAHFTTTKDPTDYSIRTAGKLLWSSGALGELPALKAAVLANTEADRHHHVQALFASITAETGENAAARRELEALAIAQPDGPMPQLYRNFLLDVGFLEEAARHIRSDIESGAADLARGDTDAIFRALLATGAGEAAWGMLLQVMREGDQRRGRQNIERALLLFQEYNTGAWLLDGLLEETRAKDPLALKERVFLADYDGALGRWSNALALIEAVKENETGAPVYQGLLRRIPDAVRAGETAKPVAAQPAPVAGVAIGLEALVPTDRAAAEAAIRAALGQATSGETEKALAALDAITLAGGALHLLPQRARAYAEAGKPEKAVADLKTYLAARPENTTAGVQLARYLAEAGNFEEAMETWRGLGASLRGGSAVEFAGALVARGRHDEARAVLESLGPVGAVRVEPAMLLARILHESGQVTEMAQMLERSHADLGENARGDLIERYIQLLRDSGLETQLLGLAADGGHPALLRATIMMAGRLGDDGRARKAAVADALAAVQFTDAYDALEFARLLHRGLERREDAVRILETAVDAASTSPSVWRGVVDELENLGEPARAIRARLALSRRYPYVLGEPEHALRIASKSGDADLADAVFQRLVDFSATDSQRAYLEALRASEADEAGDTALLQAFIASPDATWEQLRTAADIFSKRDDREHALKALDRIAQGEFGTDNAKSALLRTIELQTQAGALDQALDAFFRLLPARGGVVSAAREQILAKAEALPFEEADRLILDRVKAAPAAPGVSDLLALRSAIAVEHGVSAPALDLAALGVSPWEAGEAQYWSNLICTWRVSEPVRVSTWDEMAAPLDETLVAVLGGETPVPAGWVVTDPRKIYPDLALHNMARPGNWPSGSDYASYCLAEIESPDARTVTLAHGSWDWTRIWVNGDEILTNPIARVSLAGTDRIDVALKPGVNRILVKTRTANRDGAFSLAIIEHGEGLIVRAPETE